MNEQKQRFQPTDHPVMKIDTDLLGKLGPEEGWQYLKTREELIAREASDPFRFGYVPPLWKKASELLDKHRELLVLGGNRSGKTEWAAKEVIKLMHSKAGSVVWCFAETSATSIESQQPRLWKFMPPEWRHARKNSVTNVSFTVKNGFSEAKFVAPNGSICCFKNYAQDLSVIEGAELDMAVCDELVGLDLLDTLRFRLIDRNGRLAVTFTPVQGYSPTVASYLNGAKTIEETDAELLPKRAEKDGEQIITGYEKVPIVQMSTRNRPILYFHTRNNPWAGWSRMRKELQNETREKILCRAYGVPTKAISGRFPLFNERVHVIRHSDVPEGTRYHWVDPASGRNWFQLWSVHDSAGRCIIYREWPSVDDYIPSVGYAGEWALPDGKKMDGKAGPAQSDFGFGLERYVEEIKRVENGEKIFERYMDSRFGNAPTLAREMPTTLIDEMGELGVDFLAAPADSIDEGVAMVNSMLHYNNEQPVNALNQPKLYISERCKNTIYALATFTGADGKKGATKDPVDCLKFIALSGAGNVDGETLMSRGGGSY